MKRFDPDTIQNGFIVSSVIEKEVNIGFTSTFSVA